MKRNVGSVVLAAATLAALAGCAYQDPLALPDLGAGSTHSQYPGYGSQYPSYSPYYGYGYNYGHGSGYRPGYDPYYNYYYGADPRYYGPGGVVYVPYPRYVPVPCADMNHDGRCDQRPPKNNNGDHHHNDGDDDGPKNDGKQNGVERPPRPPYVEQGDGPRIRRGEMDRDAVQSAYPRAAPPTAILRSAPVAPNGAPNVVRAAPPPSQVVVRPQELPRRAAPPPSPKPDRERRAPPGRPATSDDDGVPLRQRQ